MVLQVGDEVRVIAEHLLLLHEIMIVTILRGSGLIIWFVGNQSIYL